MDLMSTKNVYYPDPRIELFLSSPPEIFKYFINVVFMNIYYTNIVLHTPNSSNIVHYTLSSLILIRIRIVKNRTQVSYATIYFPFKLIKVVDYIIL